MDCKVFLTAARPKETTAARKENVKVAQEKCELDESHPPYSSHPIGRQDHYRHLTYREETPKIAISLALGEFAKFYCSWMYATIFGGDIHNQSRDTFCVYVRHAVAKQKEPILHKVMICQNGLIGVRYRVTGSRLLTGRLHVATFSHIPRMSLPSGIGCRRQSRRTGLRHMPGGHVHDHAKFR